MEEGLRTELLARTKQALDAEDWDAVARLWQPWIEQGDAEAEFQLGYHYLWCTPCKDDALAGRMRELIRGAAAKDHPDALWYLAARMHDSGLGDAESDRLLLRAGQLGSTRAQRHLGVMYATGDWTGPQDLAEAARWYRLAAERGEAESQYDLGFMLLLGEGGPKNVEEGLMWLERAGEAGEYSAFRLLEDCYTNGYCGVPVDSEKAEVWRSRAEQYHRDHPPDPSLRCSAKGPVDHSRLQCLQDIEGVIGFTFKEGDSEVWVCYDPQLLGPSELARKVAALGFTAVEESGPQGQ